MNDFLFSLLALLAGLGAQAASAGMAFELAMRRGLSHWERLSWGACFLGGLLLTLHHGYTLELALRTGLYDRRQATLAALSGMLFAIGLFGLRRQRPAVALISKASPGTD